MITETQTLLTADDLWEMPPGTMQRELVRGELIETMPPGVKHGKIAVRLSSLLLDWADSGAGGHVGVESGFKLARDPDTVRGPDVYYISAARMPDTDVPTGFSEIAPDLAVEVVSPGQTAEAVQDKVSDYLQAGTRLVWVIYPRRRQVVAHTPDGLARTYDSPTLLASEDVLPGFSCSVAGLFR